MTLNDTAIGSATFGPQWQLLRMRVASGVCVAGCYTVIESWLHSKVTNETRGRAMGGYRFVDMGGSLAAQMLISVLEPASYVSYNLLAILCCASLLPLTLTTARQPELPDAPRLRPMLALTRSPLAAFGVLVAGVTSAAFRMIGPVYGQEIGLRTDEIALFLAAFVLGGALAQYPAGWLADRYDRRHALIGISVASVVGSFLAGAAPVAGPTAVFAATIFFGAATFPVFSIAAAHAHDFANDKERVELSAALMFFFALGAIASPVAVSALISSYGPRAMFFYIAAAHVALILFSLLRMRARASAKERLPYINVPRTSFIIGRLFRRKDH